MQIYSYLLERMHLLGRRRGARRRLRDVVVHNSRLRRWRRDWTHPLPGEGVREVRPVGLLAAVGELEDELEVLLLLRRRRRRGRGEALLAAEVVGGAGRNRTPPC